MEAQIKQYFPHILVNYEEQDPDKRVFVAMVKLANGLKSEYQVLFLFSPNKESAASAIRQMPKFEGIIRLDPLTTALQTLDKQAAQEEILM